MLTKYPQATGGGLQALLNSADFFLPLSDNGDGTVDTTLRRGTGTATMVRATVGWTKLASGLWSQEASGAARAHYSGADTAQGSYLGFNSEAAGIQLVTPTAAIRDMSDAAWVATNATTGVTINSISGADGACKSLGASAANGTLVFTLVAAASTRTYSCFIKRLSGTGTIEIGQWASAGAASWSVDVTSLINSDTFTRVSVTGSFLDAAFGIRIVTSGDSIAVDFNQFEAGSVATSPMDAAGAVRNMDLLTYPSAGNIDSTVGTVYAEITPFQVKNNGVAKGIVGGASGTSAPMYLSNVTSLLSIFDGAQVTFDDPGLPLATPTKVATVWSGTVSNGFINGTQGTPGVFDGNLNMGATMGIGNLATSSSPLTGPIKNVRIWKRALTLAELALLTT